MESLGAIQELSKTTVSVKCNSSLKRGTNLNLLVKQTSIFLFVENFNFANGGGGDKK